MKKLPMFFACTILITAPFIAGSQNILTKVKEKSKQRADTKVDNTIDRGLDKVEDATKEKKEQPSENNNTSTANEGNAANSNSTNTVQRDTPAVATATLKVYQNYDFVPGDKVLFEDNFNEDQDGEFPSHWELKAGQAVINKVKSDLAFFLTEGNYARVSPRMKTTAYLSDPFTVEFDTYFVPGSYGPMAMFTFNDKVAGFEREANVHLNGSEISYSGDVSFSKNLPEEIAGEAFENKWHHVAIAYKKSQLKVYVDQYRVLVVPDTKQMFERVEITGIGDEKSPIIVKNIRIASGGDMNMLGKKFTESKIVTHGINFDIDKATLKPESMGTLNMIVQVMKDNPEIKFQVQGHTDNTGTAAHNLTLSQQRADAVRNELIKMGIDASRLTAKGFGDSKPISDNTTFEGKANNRRVEFVKMQ